MGLMKPPSIVTFMLALGLGVVAIAMQLGLVLSATGSLGFWLLLTAFALLALGVVTRGL